MARYGVEPAKATVAIDFGTTYSGFSYAYRDEGKDDPNSWMTNVQCFEQWPSQERSHPYCKTQTSLLYVQRNSKPGIFELKAWGWTAFHQHRKLLEQCPLGDGKTFKFINNFKLALAGWKDGDSYALPEGFTAQRVVSDYLQQMSVLIEKELQENYGRQIGKKDIQWCLTVPSIWDNAAKEEMRRCAEIAGLVDGPLNALGDASEHPLIIVREPEAASVYCLTTCNTDLPPGSKILVVDAGGGTVDLTFQEKMESESGGYQVKEISSSSGDLCGAKFVDDAFLKFLTSKISCFDEFIREGPSAVLRIRHAWEGIKVCFDGSPGPYEFPLPAPLSRYWQKYDKAHGKNSTAVFNYNEVRITLDEMNGIFDTVLDPILELIEDQLEQVESEDVKSVTIMVVGGFSSSPYLMDRIRKKFKSRVKYIINPTQPGKAVVKGALQYGRHGRDILTSRISRMTYGVVCMQEFRRNDPESSLFYSEDGRPMCMDGFHIYARKGDSIPVDYQMKIQSVASVRDPDSIKLEMYTSTSGDPEFVTDPGTRKECTFTFPIPPREVMTEIPMIEVSMYFGRASIEVTAIGLNFRSERALLPTLTFEPRRTLKDNMSQEQTVVDKVEVLRESCCLSLPSELKVKPKERHELQEMTFKVEELNRDAGPSVEDIRVAARDAVREVLSRDMQTAYSQLMRQMNAGVHAILHQNEIIHHQVHGLEMLTVAMGNSSSPRIPYLFPSGRSFKRWQVRHLLEGNIHKCFRLQFLCEAYYKDGSVHKVDGQEGIDMKLLRPWVKKVAPFLILSLKILSMVAQTVAQLNPLTALLPTDLANYSSMLGLQQMPEFARAGSEFARAGSRCISALIDSYDKPICETEDQSDRISDQEVQLRRARAGLRDFLKTINHLDFETKIALKKVAMKNSQGRFQDVVWVCESCLREYQKLRQVEVLERVID